MVRTLEHRFIDPEVDPAISPECFMGQHGNCELSGCACECHDEAGL